MHPSLPLQASYPMDRSSLVLRVAEIERDYGFVDVALLFSIAAWVPDGFRPLWLPVAFASVAAAFTFAFRSISHTVRAFERRIERRRHETIVVAGDGFTRTWAHDGSSERCAWSDVKRVYAFKRDLYTTDLICLAFVTDDAIVETNERAEGWRELVDALPAGVPGCVPFATWYLDVVRDPFEPRLRRIDVPADGDGARDDGFPSDATAEIEIDGFVEAPDREEPYEVGFLDYVRTGTTGMLAAVVVLLVAVALVHGPRSLASVAAVEVVALVCTRAVVFGAVALRASATRRR